ncbi:Uncharacterised protein [uncultured Clostridium sp.]|nr:Uncharacterised protein [uncultured Clostridium sp.]
MNMRASSSTVQLGSCGEAFLLKQNAAICDAVAWALPMIAVFSVSVELSIPKNSARMSASATASLSRLASSESHFVAFVFVWKLCSMSM